MYCDCEVVAAGPKNDGNIYIWLSLRSSPGGSRWYQAEPKMQSEMLATALAALTSGQLVSVAFEKPETAYTTIEWIYLKWTSDKAASEI